jgi:hypothetical protein
MRSIPYRNSRTVLPGEWTYGRLLNSGGIEKRRVEESSLAAPIFPSSATLCISMSRPGQAVEVECGVYWCKYIRMMVP